MKKLCQIFNNRLNYEIFLNVMGSFIIRGMSMIINFLLIPAYLQFFEEQLIVGIWFTLISILTAITTIDLGLGNGIRNRLPAAIISNNKNEIGQVIVSGYSCITKLVIIMAVIGNIVIPFVPWIDIFKVDDNFLLTIIISVYITYNGIMIQFILRTITSILYALQQSRIVNMISLLSNIIILIVMKISSLCVITDKMIFMSIINAFALNIPLVIVTFYTFKKYFSDIKLSPQYYSKDCAKQLLQSGLVIFILQIIFTAISYTKEFLISTLTSPEYVVEYQAYFKIFNLWASIVSLAMTPIWSAVTKAKEQRQYQWVKKLSHILYALGIFSFLFEFAIIPFFEDILDIWIGSESDITIKNLYLILMAISSAIYIIHSINTSLGNGFMYFKPQLILVSLAAIINIPLSILLVEITHSWIGVITANIISLLPYEVAEIVCFEKHLNRYM